MAFKSGQSGNPGGRPKDLGAVKELAKAHTTDAIRILADILHNGEDGRTKIAAAESLLSRAWGKCKESVEISGTLESIIVNVIKKDK